MSKHPKHPRETFGGENTEYKILDGVKEHPLMSIVAPITIPFSEMSAHHRAKETAHKRDEAIDTANIVADRLETPGVAKPTGKVKG